MTVIDIKTRTKRPTKKKKRKLKRQVHWDLLAECQRTGPPDMELLDKILDNIDSGNISDTDIFAMYLYRKKAKR